MSKQTVSVIHRRSIFEAYDSQCFYCRKPLAWRDVEIDHLIPERLADNPVKLEETLARYGLPATYDLRADNNLVPACRPCNSDKSDILPEPSLAALWLSRTATRAERISELREKYTRFSKTEKLMLGLATAVASGAITSENLTAELRRLEEGGTKFNLYESLEFFDGTSVSELRRGDIGALLDRPVRLGMNTFKGLNLSNDEGGKRMVYTCREYHDALEDGFYALTTFDMKMEAFFARASGILQAVEKALPAEQSYIRDPHVGLCDLHLLPSDFVPSLIDLNEEERPEVHRALSLADLREGGHLRDIITTSKSLQYEYAGMERTCFELFRADLNEDGVEDMLIFFYDRAIGGTFGAGGTMVLTRLGSDRQLEMICLDDSL